MEVLVSLFLPLTRSAGKFFPINGPRCFYPF